MNRETHTPLRHQERYNHIHIRVQVLEHDRWVFLQALGWNAVGFKFFHTEVLTGPILQFKRGLTRFEGALVWCERGSNDELLAQTLLNDLIYQQSRTLSAQPALQLRLVKLIRTPGLAAEKRKVLASLGLQLSDEQLAELLAQKKLERPLFQYGVKVDSEAWRSIVTQALDLSSVVMTMEKWVQDLHT